MAAMYYAEEERKLQQERQASSPEDAKNGENPYDQVPREEQPSFLSPLNFSKLAIGGEVSQEQSVEEEERLEQQSIIILESVIKSNDN